MPRNWDRRPFLLGGNTLIERAAELLDPVVGGWDMQLVNSIFLKPDADVILSISVKEDMKDAWAWHFDTQGVFSVKSAYRLQRQLNEVARGAPGAVDVGDEPSFTCKSIWQSPRPMNIQQFLWRLAHDSLPLGSNLKRKGIELDTLCRCANDSMRMEAIYFLNAS